jgi:hypothetical protein
MAVQLDVFGAVHVLCKDAAVVSATELGPTCSSSSPTRRRTPDYDRDDDAFRHAKGQARAGGVTFTFAQPTLEMTIEAK